MLESFARRLGASARARHLLFLFATAFTICFVGYHFGTFDQVVHIPFLKKYADAALFPGDAFVDLRQQHFSYFWFFFLPFYRAGYLEAAMFGAHVLATYGTFWALWRLSDTLFGDPLINLFSLGAFMFPHMGFSAFPVIEFSLLPRTVVEPFLILALALYLRRRTWLAFGLLGVMYNLHAVSVNFVLGMLLLDIGLGWRRVGLRGLAGGLALFGLAALPVLAWSQRAEPVDLSLRPEWLSIISRSTFYHLFYFFTPIFSVAVVTVSGFSTLILFGLGRRAGPPGPHDRSMTVFVAAILLILAAQVVVTYWLPVTLIVEFQIARAGVFLLIFGYLYFARYLVSAYRSGRWQPADLAALAGAYMAGPFPFLPLLALGLRQALRSARWRQAAMAGAAGALVIGGVGLAVHYRLWHPGIYVYARQTDWYKAQVWARQNTPPDAVFIVPPYEWWLYDSDWRVFSERSPVVTHAELLEAAFAPAYLDRWLPRFRAVAPGALDQFRGDIYENVQLMAQAYKRLTPADFQDIARQYGASYVVVERPQPCGFPAVYENPQFVVCDLRPGAVAQ